MRHDDHRQRRRQPYSIDEDVRRELRSHLDLRVDELVAGGVPEAEARRRALGEFGDPDRVAESCRRIATATPPAHGRRGVVTALAQDVRYALRNLVANPAFTVAACLTLALGIGANAAIFSVVNGVLLRPLPYPEADRVVSIWERTADGRDNSVAGANFVDWQERSKSFDAMALIPSYRFGGRATVLGSDLAARLYVAGVTAGFFDTIGVHPWLGRGFAPDETVPGAAPVIVVSHAVWQQMLGAVPDLTGQALSVYGLPAPVVGVMPAGFTFPANTDVWFPQEVAGWSESRTAHGFAAIGRLRADVPLAVAAAEIDAIGATLARQYGDETDAAGVTLRPLHEELVGDRQLPLMLLLGASAALLLVACANLAGALLARGSARGQELAVRAALGAGRGRLVRQLLTESAVLAAMGTVAGLALAHWGRPLLLSMAPTTLPPGTAAPMDARVVAYTVALSAITAAIFGLLPALRASRQDPGDALRGGSRGNSHRGDGWLWSGLVVAEVAMAVTLLLGAGLLTRSLWQVLATDAGFDAEGLLTIDLSLPAENYPEDADIRQLHDRLQAELSVLPGVRSVGLTSHLPLGGTTLNGAFDVEGSEPGSGYADYRVAGPGYFGTMGIAVLAGAEFGESIGAADSAPVAIVNESVAEQLWPGEDAVGKRIGNLANDSWVYGSEWMTVVGVVADVRQRGLESPAARAVYVDYRQRPMRARNAVFVLAVDGDAVALTAAARERLRSVDDQIPADFLAMPVLVAGSVSDRRFTVIVLGSFALSALLLASIGIHAVASYSVARRTHEMGIRLALGAAPRHVQWMVVGACLRPVAMGLVVGALAASALGTLLASLLHGVGTADPLTLLAVAALLGGVAWIACLLPARRVARIDPLSTMRAN